MTEVFDVRLRYTSPVYQTTRDLVDLYSANDTRSLITNVTIDKFLVKSLMSNPDYASYANLLMTSLQQGSIY